MKNNRIYWVAIIAFAITACAPIFRPRTLTPAELDERGTRVYSADVPTGMKAASVALQTLGYDIIVNDPASGLIKTGPRDIQVSAAGGTMHRDELAWVIVISAHGNGTIQVRATPHPSTNGIEVAPTDVAAAAIEPRFTTLWNALDADMKQISASAR